MKLKFVFVLLLIFSGIAAGQETQKGESSKIEIPESIKQEIVRRILIFKFKPSKLQKIIYLASEGINPTWLPKITNTEFKLLSDEEIEDGEREVYFFIAPELENKNYSIGFAFGTPKCSYIGDEWNFRITNNKLRLWYATGIGGFCSGRKFNTAGKLNTYPNELEGYKFFDKGKLNGLKLTVSTKEDVKKNFGSDCDSGCDYDDNWKINFNYFGLISKEITVDNRRIKYVPREEFIGKIDSISFIPQRQISFIEFVFPSKFSQSHSFSVGHNYDTDGRMSTAVGTSYKTYIDRYGLRYEIFEDGYTVGEAEKRNWRKGDLVLIEYSIPDKIEETMFIEEQ